MFRIKNGHVDYRTRYAKNQRWKAQHAARRSLFGMYRNPFTDDPSVKGLSRGTANTQLFVHHGKLLVFKEDSPPVYMDPVTLETLDDYYTFGGKLESETHTAHPKIDPVTGEYIAFGYEADGFLSKNIRVFSADRSGQVNWSVLVEGPHNGMMHDFVVTQRHIVLYLTNSVGDLARMQAGGVHWSYDSKTPCYMGVFRRGGDGKDIRWFRGENLFCTHTMGGWSDGDKITVDWDGGESNQFAFFPNLHEPFDRAKSTGLIRRFTIDLSSRSNDTSREVQVILDPGDGPFEPGTSWAVLFVQTSRLADMVPPGGDRQVQVRLVERVGVFVFADAEPEPRPLPSDVEITGLERADGKMFLAVSNPSRYLRLVTEGYVVVTPLDGRPAERWPVQTFRLLPDSLMKHEIPVPPSAVGLGKCNVLVVLDYGAEDLVAGEQEFEF
jgi:hypothetical protein